MNRTLATGVALTGVGLTWYVAGVAAGVPGRALSLTALMVGVTLLVIGQANAGQRP